MQTEPMMQDVMEFAPDADRAGFRLHELAVYNWGTFHGAPYSIHPDGRTAILTGGNGTGKSTLADALLTLLVPNKTRNYNQAGQSHERTERTEKDYVLGAYSEKHDEAIRQGRKEYLRREVGHYSVLLAAFFNEDLNSWVTLAQVLWQNTTGRIEKIFITEKRRLTIPVEFADLGSPSTFRRVLKEDRGLTLHDSFTAYSERFHELLCMNRIKSPMEIFNQAICIKDIPALTEFIRRYMLDDGGSAERLEALRRNFVELRDTNRRIELATRQKSALDRIYEDHQALTALQQALDEARTREEVLTPYFAEEELRLRLEQKTRLDTEALKLKADLTLVVTRSSELARKIDEIKESLSGSEDGRRLRAIAELLKTLEAEKLSRKKARDAFERLLAKWRPNLPAGDALAHAAILRSCNEETPALVKRQGAIDERDLPELQLKRNELFKTRETLEGEQRSLMERQSNIPVENLRSRAFIAEGLGLKPGDLPFVGELVQVRSSQARWTGAVERLVHSFALCLLVRADLRERVDAFVHSTRQKGLVVYHAVPEKAGRSGFSANPESVAAKLEVKAGQGTLGEWLESELARRFDHIACEDTLARFREAENALTIRGLIKQRGTERRKDDRRELEDASSYVLGWDNREKIAALAANLKTVQAQIARAESGIETLKTERAALEARIGSARRIVEEFGDYAGIDWQSVATQIEEKEAERRRLQESSDSLKALEREKEQAERELEAVLLRKEALNKQEGALEERAGANDKAAAERRRIVELYESHARENPRVGDFRSLYPEIAAMLAFPLVELSKLDGEHRSLSDKMTRERRKLQEAFNNRAEVQKRQMSDFHHGAENEEFKDLLAVDYALHGYNNDLFTPFESVRQRIIGEDLPKNQKRFESLLQTTVSDDFSSWDMLLEEHAKRIRSRIGELNGQLCQIDFDRREHTYIQLKTRDAEADAVREFRQSRRHVLEDALDMTGDREILRERYRRIEALLDRMDKDPAWTASVIDVRNWFEFRADEFYRANDELRQSYTGASGKSGGEKNRLASTILATAIAYQYGISVNNRQTETFRLVAVDEMFSKTDDDFSKYLLELFKEFHLQLLVIQPLDAKIHLVQPYVERYHIVTRRGENSTVRTISVSEYKKMRGEP
jgi:uncharacterized protein YPO0396